ncbi:methyltransferase domain-containing protein [Perkinsela sp. CCAP 1560/4]|nr:methyltransferase domain-containing protein [Perkinsela sp. CCAP 1560/4]|eukprot:KNH03786.1 methyltransferase domain-containing protein [Perkinsela sp. CCAP 1560/4]
MSEEIYASPYAKLDYRPYTGAPIGISETVTAPSLQTKNYIARTGLNNFSRKDKQMEVVSADAQKVFWDLFYRSKGSGQPVYPNRNYFISEFPALCEFGVKSLLEIGCGNGSTIVPLVELQRNRISGKEVAFSALQEIAGMDISWTSLEYCTQAIEKLFQERPTSLETDVIAESHIKIGIEKHLTVVLLLADITSFSLLDNHKMVRPYEAVSMIFVLSALPPKCAQQAIRNAYSLLSPNGYLFYRDYDFDDIIKSERNELDSASLRGEYECFSRKNGTLITLYCREYLFRLFELVGLKIMSQKVVTSCFTNKKISKSWERKYFQCILYKSV